LEKEISDNLPDTSVKNIKEIFERFLTKFRWIFPRSENFLSGCVADIIPVLYIRIL
jgi:hypothetical protein